MNLRQKAVKGVIWSVIQSWGSRVVSLVVFFLLARLLDPEAFGLVALAGIFVTFMEVFIDQGFSTAIIQRHELEVEHLDTAFWINIGIGLLLTVFGITVAGLVANFFGQPQLTLIIQWLSTGFLLNAFSSVQDAILQRKFAYKALAIRSLLAGIVGGVVGVTMAFMSFGVWSLVAQLLTHQLIRGVVLWWASDWRPGLNVSKRHFRELFAFGMNIVGVRLFDFINSKSDDLLIGYFLGNVALGYYTIAYRLVIVITDLTKAISQVAMPGFSMLQQEPERLKRVFYITTELASFIAFPVFFGLAALAPTLVRSLLGVQWLPSIPIIQVLALIGIFHTINFFNTTVITAMGRPFWNLKINFANSICNIAAFALVVQWGAITIAAAYVICSYLFFPIYLWTVRKLIHIKATIYFRQFTASTIASLVMVAILLGTQYSINSFVSSQALLAICLVVGILTYTLLVILLAPKIFQQLLNLIFSSGTS